MTHKAAGHKAQVGKKKGRTMDPAQRTSERVDPKPETSSDREDRRTRRRDEGAISRIEDITYAVLRKHKPQP